VHYLRAGLDGSGRIVAWQHRVACDEITAFQDPVRYKGGGERDFLAMAGSELRTYDIPNRLSEQLPQATGIRTSSLRGIGFGPNKFATEAFPRRDRGQARLDPVELRLQLLRNTPRGQAIVREVVAMSGTGAAAALAFRSSTTPGRWSPQSPRRRWTRSGEITVRQLWLALDPGIAVHPDNVVAQTGKLDHLRPGARAHRAHHVQGRGGAAVEHPRLRRAAHGRRAGAPHQARVDAEPSDGRRADGDPGGGAGDRERGAWRRAAPASGIRPSCPSACSPRWRNAEALTR
jgi:hypothetical protein